MFFTTFRSSYLFLLYLLRRIGYLFLFVLICLLLIRNINVYLLSLNWLYVNNLCTLWPNLLLFFRRCYWLFRLRKLIWFLLLINNRCLRSNIFIKIIFHFDFRRFSCLGSFLMDFTILCTLILSFACIAFHFLIIIWTYINIYDILR